MFKSQKKDPKGIYAFFLYDYTQNDIVCEAFDLKHIPKYNFWQNWQLTEAMKDLALDLVRNLPDHEGDWSIVFSRTFEDYVGHIFHSAKKQGLMVVTNRHYPVEHVHLFFKEVVTLRKTENHLFLIDPSEANQPLTKLLVEWNKLPHHSESKLDAIDEDLSEIKQILEENINKVIHRGESIEELLQKSQTITESSKLFLKRTKKLNRCCILL